MEHIKKTWHEENKLENWQWKFIEYEVIRTWKLVITFLFRKLRKGSMIIASNVALKKGKKNKV